MWEAQHHSLRILKLVIKHSSSLLKRRKPEFKLLRDMEQLDVQYSAYTSSTDTKNGKSIYLAIELVVLFLLATAVWGLFSLPAVFYLGQAETPDAKVCTYDGSKGSVRYNTCMHALNVRGLNCNVG